MSRDTDINRGSDLSYEEFPYIEKVETLGV